MSFQYGLVLKKNLKFSNLMTHNPDGYLEKGKLPWILPECISASQ